MRASVASANKLKKNNYKYFLRLTSYDKAISVRYSGKRKSQVNKEKNTF